MNSALNKIIINSGSMPFLDLYGDGWTHLKVLYYFFFFFGWQVLHAEPQDQLYGALSVNDQSGIKGDSSEKTFTYIYMYNTNVQGGQ